MASQKWQNILAAGQAGQLAAESLGGIGDTIERGYGGGLNLKELALKKAEQDLMFKTIFANNPELYQGAIVSPQMQQQRQTAFDQGGVPIPDTIQYGDNPVDIQTVVKNKLAEEARQFSMKKQLADIAANAKISYTTVPTSEGLMMAATRGPNVGTAVPLTSATGGALRQTVEQQQFSDDKGNLFTRPKTGGPAQPVLDQNNQQINIGIPNKILQSSEGMFSVPTKGDQMPTQIMSPQGKPLMPLGVLNPDTVNYLSQRYQATGEMPSLGMGSAGAMARSQILNQAANQAGASGQTVGEQLAAQAGYKADAGELKNLQKQRGAILAFENTAQKNIEQVRKLSPQVNRTSIPLINAAIQAGRTNITGDPIASAYAVAVKTVADEYTKVTASQGGITSDAARANTYGLLNTAQTPEQMDAVLNQMQIDMGNRRSGYEDQINAIKSSISGPKKQTQDQSPSDYQEQQNLMEKLRKKHL